MIVHIIYAYKLSLRQIRIYIFFSDMLMFCSTTIITTFHYTVLACVRKIPNYIVNKAFVCSRHIMHHIPLLYLLFSMLFEDSSCHHKHITDSSQRKKMHGSHTCTCTHTKYMPSQHISGCSTPSFWMPSVDLQATQRSVDYI